MALTKQEVFDKVCDHFKAQKKQARSGAGCQYLTKSGLKCAIGIFIPNGHEGNRFSGPVGLLFDKYPEIKNIFEPSYAFLTSIQGAHDAEVHWNTYGFNARGWHFMREIANDYDLNTSHID